MARGEGLVWWPKAWVERDRASSCIPDPELCWNHLLAGLCPGRLFLRGFMGGSFVLFPKPWLPSPEEFERRPCYFGPSVCSASLGTPPSLSLHPQDYSLLPGSFQDKHTESHEPLELGSDSVINKYGLMPFYFVFTGHCFVLFLCSASRR